MNVLVNILPKTKQKRKWISILFTTSISFALILLGIFGFREYGIGLFVLIPFFIGYCTVYLFGLRHTVSRKEAFGVAYLSLFIVTLILLLFAIEGLICIIMASPIAMMLTWVGATIAYFYVEKTHYGPFTTLIILFLLIPFVSFVEHKIEPDVIPVVTSIEIDARADKVWKNVVEFPQLEEPKELMFKTGIAYPINATIEGNGVGAVRYCNFTTGAFVEPITVWNENELLAFSVKEQPIPMQELNFWDIDAPHLHDYFVSKKGQFKLTALPNGKTLLEGTTWYTNKIKPAFYWEIWSDYIIHKIHLRVLEHIKKNAEARSAL